MTNSKNDTNNKTQQSQYQYQQRIQELEQLVNEQQIEIQQKTQQAELYNAKLSGLKAIILRGDLNAAVHAAHDDIMQMSMEHQARADRLNRIKQMEIADKQAKQWEQDVERITKEIPGIKPEHERRVIAAKKQTEENIRKLENFLALDEDGLRTLQSTKHSIYESPTRFIFTNLNDGTLRCDVCLHIFYRLDLAEEHLHDGDDFNVHKQKALEQIKHEEQNKLSELETDYNLQISGAIYRMHTRDNRTANERRYEKQAKEQQVIKDSVLVRDDVTAKSNEQELRPWPPRITNTRA